MLGNEFFRVPIPLYALEHNRIHRLASMYIYRHYLWGKEELVASEQEGWGLEQAALAAEPAREVEV